MQCLAGLEADQLAAVRSEPCKSAGFVLAHDAAVTADSGGKNGRKTAFYPLCAHSAFSLRNPFELSSNRVLVYQSAPLVVADQPRSPSDF